MKLWKRKLKNELKNALPKLNDSVLNAPILSADGQVINADNSKKNEEESKVDDIVGRDLLKFCQIKSADNSEYHSTSDENSVPRNISAENIECNAVYLKLLYTKAGKGQILHTFHTFQIF